MSTRVRPLFSVVTVVLNGGESFAQTVSSVIGQTCQDREYLIIDGGSTDQTLLTIKKWERHITYWSSEVDQGIYHAMNKAIGVLSGEFVLFLNSGDYLHDKEVLERYTHIITEHDDIVAGAVIYEDISSGKKYYSRPKLKYFKYRMPVYHQGTFYKSKKLKLNTFNEEYKIAADYDQFLTLIGIGSKVRVSSEVVSVFRSGGVSHKLSSHYKELFKIHNEHFGSWQGLLSLFLTPAMRLLAVLKKIVRKP